MQKLQKNTAKNYGNIYGRKNIRKFFRYFWRKYLQKYMRCIVNRKFFTVIFVVAKISENSSVIFGANICKIYALNSKPQRRPQKLTRKKERKNGSRPPAHDARLTTPGSRPPAEPAHTHGSQP